MEQLITYATRNLEDKIISLQGLTAVLEGYIMHKQEDIDCWEVMAILDKIKGEIEQMSRGVNGEV